MRPTYTPTGVERLWDENDIIVSKTDLKGHITYANRLFIEVSGYSEDELLGEPHNIIRHPDMPRCVFKLLWDTIMAGDEIFAYVVNLCKGGDHYWVNAHVTPTFDESGAIVSYHSNRRVPSREAVAKATDLYATLLAEENRHSNIKEGMAEGTALLNSTLAQAGVEYDEFVFSI